MRGSALLLIAQASGHAIAPEAQDVDISLYTGLTTPSRISGSQKCKCVGGNGQEHFIGNTVAGTLRRRRGAPGATCGTGNNEECIPTPRYPASYGEACEAHAEPYSTDCTPSCYMYTHRASCERSRFPCPAQFKTLTLDSNPGC